MKKVGVLSLQGDFAAHGAALERAGAVPVYIRERAQLGDIDGLILPGGESTTMLKLLRQEDLFDDLAEFGRRKRSEEHTSELQSLRHLVCRLLLEKKQ